VLIMKVASSFGKKKIFGIKRGTKKETVDNNSRAEFESQGDGRIHEDWELGTRGKKKAGGIGD